MRILLIDSNHIFQTIYLSSNQSKEPNVVEYFKSCFFSIKRAIKEIQPSHVLFAMDDYSSSWRKSVFAEYGKNHFVLPVAFENRIGIFIEQLKSEGISSIAYNKMESKDIIATICSKMKGFDVATIYILGVSRRLFPLLDKNICLRNHFAKHKDEINKTDSWFFNTYGVSPKQWIDVMLLAGESSSNIPGITGIGEKTAISLIKEFGNVLELQHNACCLSGKKGLQIRSEINDVINKYQPIIKLRDDINLGINLRSLIYKKPNQNIMEYQ